jgi:hypothetical protein
MDRFRDVAAYNRKIPNRRQAIVITTEARSRNGAMNF